MKRLAYLLATAGDRDDRPHGTDLLDDFLARCRSLEWPRILELGTKRTERGRTRRDHWFPNAGEYLGTDMEPDADVDIVADVHRLTSVTGEEEFDAILACSVFEHLKYPHLAAHEVMKALRVGGLLYVQTHQCFPLHSYPHDYFRFSREALAGLFGTKMGFRVVGTDYQFPAYVLARRDPVSMSQPAFLNVNLFGEKVARTPAEFIYEHEVSI